MSCKYCKTEDVIWKKVAGVWVLHNLDGTQNDCRKFKKVEDPFIKSLKERYNIVRREMEECEDMSFEYSHTFHLYLDALEVIITADTGEPKTEAYY